MTTPAFIGGLAIGVVAPQFFWQGLALMIVHRLYAKHKPDTWLGTDAECDEGWKCNFSAGFEWAAGYQVGNYLIGNYLNGPQ
jgi:hypothetical protein